MDSRGIFDSMTRNISSLHGLRSSRAGYELTLSVQQAMRVQTRMRWVNGLAMLADCLTKAKTWRLIHDESFTAGKKLKKRELIQATKDQEAQFIEEVEKIAKSNCWPWHSVEPRSMVDDLTEHVALIPNQEYSVGSPS